MLRLYRISRAARPPIKTPSRRICLFPDAAMVLVNAFFNRAICHILNLINKTLASQTSANVKKKNTLRHSAFDNALYASKKLLHS